MIFEIATLTIDPANAEPFVAAAARAEPLFRAFPECHGFGLRAVIERPGEYHLMIAWTSVEAHEDFRATEDFQKWRGLVGPFFTQAPQVVHTEAALGDMTIA